MGKYYAIGMDSEFNTLFCLVKNIYRKNDNIFIVIEKFETKFIKEYFSYKLIHLKTQHNLKTFLNLKKLIYGKGFHSYSYKYDRYIYIKRICSQNFIIHWLIMVNILYFKSH